MQSTAPMYLPELLRSLSSWERLCWLLLAVIGLIVAGLVIYDMDSFGAKTWKLLALVALLQSMWFAWRFDPDTTGPLHWVSLILGMLAAVVLGGACYWSSLSLAFLGFGLVLVAFARRYESDFTWLHGVCLFGSAVVISLNRPILAVIEQAFVEQSARSVSPLLDFFATPNMAYVDSIQLGDKWIDLGRYCFGISSLGWVTFFVVVYLQHRPRSFVCFLGLSILAVPVALTVHFVWILLTNWFGGETEYFEPARFSGAWFAWGALNFAIALIFVRFIRLLFLPIRLAKSSLQEAMPTQIFNRLVTWPAGLERMDVSHAASIEDDEANSASPTASNAPNESEEEHDESSRQGVETEINPTWLVYLGLCLVLSAFALGRVAMRSFRAVSEKHPTWSAVVSDRLSHLGIGPEKRFEPNRPTNDKGPTHTVAEYPVEIDGMSGAVYAIPGERCADFPKWMLANLHAIQPLVSFPKVPAGESTAVTPTPANPVNLPMGEQPVFFFQFSPEHRYLAAWSMDSQVEGAGMHPLKDLGWVRLGNLIQMWLYSESWVAREGCLALVMHSTSPMRVDLLAAARERFQTIAASLQEVRP